MDTREKRPANPKRRPERDRRSPSAGKQQTRRRPAPAKRAASQTGTRRAVRPPREDIPDVVYTMPKPFRKGRFLLRLVSVAAVAVAAVFALSLFLRVDTVQVAGAVKYSPWAVREASGVQEGDSLLGVNRAKLAGRIVSKLPYVDQAKISIDLPGTVNIEITELKVTYAVEATDGSWWLTTSDGRVVEEVDGTAAADHPVIAGVKAESPQVGQMLRGSSEQAPATEPPAEEEPAQTEEPEETLEDQPEQETTQPAAQPQSPPASQEDRMETALAITRYLEQSEAFGQVTAIHVENLSDLSIQYGDRIRARLGTTERLEYKIGYMAQAIRQLPANEAGELDVSFALGEEAIFTPTA